MKPDVAGQGRQKFLPRLNITNPTGRVLYITVVCRLDCGHDRTFSTVRPTTQMLDLPERVTCDRCCGTHRWDIASMAGVYRCTNCDARSLEGGR